MINTYFSIIYQDGGSTETLKEALSVSDASGMFN